MQIDTTTLTKIQEYRIEADPIVGNTHSSGPNLNTQITAGRRTLFEDTPNGDRIKLAAWGELIELCAIASLTHAAFTNAKFVALLQYSLREMLKSTSAADHDATNILPSNFPTLPADETIRQDAHDLREALKRDRDRWFVDHVDDLEIATDGVPDAFWLHSNTTSTGDILVDRYAEGEVTDQFRASLPTLPGQGPNTNEDVEEGGATTSSTNSGDPAQAGLDMF